MVKKKTPLSTVVSLMSEETQARMEEQAQAETQVSTTFPIDSILPDFDQPRRLLPDDLAEAVAKGEMRQFDAIKAWLQRGESSDNIEKLKSLADSIERHGLISPISIREPRAGEKVPPGIDHLIVTGERRFWSHILLAIEGRQIHEGDRITSPTRIKATIAPPGITVRAHQLIENLLREDINAVERARGLWALRYELSGISSPDEVHGRAPFPPNREPGLVPWREVEATLGIQKRYRIYTTNVLNLCPEAQTLVGKHNLAEWPIRPVVQKLKDRPDLQVRAIEQLAIWLEEEENEEGRKGLTASIQELVDRLLAGDTKAIRRVSSAPVNRLGGQVRRTLDFLDRLKNTDRDELSLALGQKEFAEVAIDLRNLRRQIDEILEAAAADTQENLSEMLPIDEDSAE